MKNGGYLYFWNSFLDLSRITSCQPNYQPVLYAFLQLPFFREDMHFEELDFSPAVFLLFPKASSQSLLFFCHLLYLPFLFLTLSFPGYGTGKKELINYQKSYLQFEHIKFLTEEREHIEYLQKSLYTLVSSYLYSSLYLLHTFYFFTIFVQEIPDRCFWNFNYC